MQREPTATGSWTQINGWKQKEEINFQWEQNEETRIQKNGDRLRKLQDIFKHSNIRIIGVPEREEEEQEVKNLLEPIMKEKYSKSWKARTYIQDYCIQQSYHLEWRADKVLPR